MLETKLLCIERFKGMRCCEEKSTENFFGYKLNGIYKGAERKQVYAGLILDDGLITGVGYYADDVLYKKGFVEGKYLSDLKDVVEELTIDLAEDLDVGSREWLDFRFPQVVPALINDFSDVCNDRTNRKIFSFSSVIVELGFTSVYTTVFFGFNEATQKFVISLTSSRNGAWGKVGYRSDFEAVFDDAKEGNRVFRMIRDSAFVSKKGNTVYKIKRDDFNKLFHRVEGKFFELEG